MSLRPFAFHVPASSYRRRPTVRLAVASHSNPFAPWPELTVERVSAAGQRRARIARALVLACIIAGSFVAGQLVTLHSLGVL